MTHREGQVMGPMEIIIILVVLGGAVAGYVWWSRTRDSAEEETYHFRCPGCRRRLRYRQRQVGHKGQCSHCHQELVFPPLSQALRG
jgi:hypothetical protein